MVMKSLGKFALMGMLSFSVAIADPITLDQICDGEGNLLISKEELLKLFPIEDCDAISICRGGNVDDTDAIQDAIGVMVIGPTGVNTIDGMTSLDNSGLVNLIEENGEAAKEANKDVISYTQEDLGEDITPEVQMATMSFAAPAALAAPLAAPAAPASDTTPPTITSNNTYTVNENQTGAFTVVATDVNDVTYSLSGTDASSFNIDSDSGVVSFVSAPDYEAKDTYNITVTATDSETNASSQNVTITIQDVTELDGSLLAPADLSTGDSFGYGIAMDGTYTVVAATKQGTGVAYVIENATSSVLYKLNPTDGSASDFFGQAIAISDDYIAIGSYRHSSNTGAVYVFNTSDGSFRYKINGERSNGSFGYNKLVINGNNLLIGSYVGGEGFVSAYDASSGAFVRKFQAQDGNSSDQFGKSFDSDGNYLVVGALADDDNGGASGSAYVFDLSSGAQLRKITPADGATGDNFGYSVAMDGTTAAISATGDNRGSTDNHGSVYLFDVTNGTQINKIVETDVYEDTFRNISPAFPINTNLFFGQYMHMENNRLLVGVPMNKPDNSTRRGSVFVYSTTGTKLDKLVPTTSTPASGYGSFGVGLELDGTTAVIGDSAGDGVTNATGIAYYLSVN